MARVAHLVSCLLVLTVTPLSSWVRHTTVSSAAIIFTQIAKEATTQGRPRKSMELDEKGDDPSWSQSGGFRVRGRFKPHAGGYDPQRIQRFWRHYHAAQPEEKRKRPQVER